MNRRNLFQSLVAPILGFLGFETREPFAWVLAITHCAEDGKILSASYNIAYVGAKDYWLGDWYNAKEYIYRLKKHVEDIKGTKTDWNGWSLMKREIFPLYK